METLQELTPEQQQKVLEYAQTLQQEEDTVATLRKAGSWHNHPAIGMWKDREDMKDSVDWVRQMRKKHWRQE
jgi:hypothetical protein